MDCTAVRGWFYAHLAGRLAADERTWIEEHLKGCEQCRAELVSLQQTLKAVKANLPPPTPELSPEQQAQFAPSPWWRILGRQVVVLWPRRVSRRK